MAKKTKDKTAEAAPAASGTAAPETTAAPAPEQKPAKAPKAPKEPKPEVVKEPEQNGVRKPAPGGKTRVPWDIADTISAEAGRPATRKEVVDAAIAVGCNPAMSQSQYARWRKFHGLTGRVSAPVATGTTGAPVDPNPAPPAPNANFDVGYDAYANGTTRDQNPHEVGSPDHDAWNRGFDTAAEDANRSANG
jgi:hypothetical protein